MFTQLNLQPTAYTWILRGLVLLISFFSLVPVPAFASKVPERSPQKSMV